MIYTFGNLNVYIGDISHALYPNNDLERWQQSKNLLQDSSFLFLKETFGTINSLFCAHQIHTIEGKEVTKNTINTLKPFVTESDFLYTNNRDIGLGVLTADCVPIVLYDKVKNACTIVHAGWRGAIAGIIFKAINSLQICYGSDLRDLKIIFGPSARSCCYKVNQHFMLQLEENAYTHTALQQREGNLFFDIPTFIVNQCIDAGIPLLHINLDYCLCTICSLQFCSYRRQQKEAGRQLTVAMLTF